MSVPIQPLADYVVAQPEKAEAKTASGFYLPDAAKEKPKFMKVVGIGPDVKKIKVGDMIIFKDFSGTAAPIGKDEYTIVKEEDILATVK
jgi:chaperonin GroES